MELWTNETCCGRGFWVLCCTNRKLLNFVASQAIAVTLVAWNHQLSLITNDFWFVSHYKCLWVWTSFWKAWWKSALWISSPTQHTELSLWMAAARGFSDTQRLLSKSHNRNKNKAWAQNYSWPARPIRPAHNIQNTLSEPTRLHSTRPSDLHTQFISLSLWSRDWNGWNGRRDNAETWKVGEKGLFVPRDETKTFSS